MLQRVITVALNAYREAVRARILLGLVGVAFAVALYSLVVGAFTLNDAPRVVADLGCMAISVFSITVAILIGATALHRELEQKTILPLLARPIRRGEYLTGKYLGTMLVVAVFVMAEGGAVLMMSAGMGGRSIRQVLVLTALLVGGLGVVAWRVPRARTFGPIFWAAIVMVVGIVLCADVPAERSLILASAALTLCEVAIIAAIATFFSSFSTPFLSALLTIWMVVIGRSADSMARMPVKVFGQTAKDVFGAMATVVPNLHVYVPSRTLLTGEAPDANLMSYLGMAFVQSLGWTVGLLAVAAFIFRRRDFL
ncbi:MAG: ABC transporter permease subunit [Deltaproteobacteria bacterium]|nr:ABC transporter permease subunit [Deltaproteobacteria bacterium]